MSARMAVGIGCRLGCPADAIESLVHEALKLASADVQPRLFTIEDKRQEIGLTQVASRLGLDLVFFSRDALREQALFVRTRSPRTERLFGVPSVAEAAALAGAGPGAILIVPRMAANGATCAVAGPSL